ncbi:MAG: invasion associated locus B family protein [Alphaproteobacteria bacterium]
MSRHRSTKLVVKCLASTYSITLAMINWAGRIFLVLFVLLPATSLDAQDQPRSNASPSSSVWVTKCASVGRKEALDCSVEQTVILTKTQQFLLSVVIRVPPDTREPGMMIHLPLGLFLPAGVTVQLEGQKPQQLQIQTCEAKGCYAGTAVSSAMLAAMKQSERLTIIFEDLPKNKISVPVPLKGFAEAYQKIQ